MNKNNYFDIKKCGITIETVLKDENLSKERFEELKNFKMLALPKKKYHNTEGNFFHSATRDFYLYCRQENPGNYFDFCTEKKFYKEISLNANELFLGGFIIINIALPIFINLISSFIYKKLTEKNDKVNVDIIVQNEKSKESHEIIFRGTREDFEEKVVKTLLTYTKDGKIRMSEQVGENINVLS
jgi:hypothetical protein